MHWGTHTYINTYTHFVRTFAPTYFVTCTGMYEGDSELREGHLLMEGGVLSMTSDTACVRVRLEALFTSVDHCSARERRGCALAFGFVCHRYD
jgi:hypothetical protein